MELQRLAKQLGEAFPTAASVSPLTVPGEGFGSLVVESAGGFVFRVAKHAEARRGHQRERIVLPIVQRALQEPARAAGVPGIGTRHRGRQLG